MIRQTSCKPRCGLLPLFWKHLGLQGSFAVGLSRLGQLDNDRVPCLQSYLDDRMSARDSSVPQQSAGQSLRPHPSVCAHRPTPTLLVGTPAAFTVTSATSERSLTEDSAIDVSPTSRGTRGSASTSPCRSDSQVPYIPKSEGFYKLSLGGRTFSPMLTSITTCLPIHRVVKVAINTL